MLFLLDANVLITAHNDYYPVNRVPEFWDWLLHYAQEGHVKMPLEMFEEIKDGTGDPDKDLLFGWVKDQHVKDLSYQEGNHGTNDDPQSLSEDSPERVISMFNSISDCEIF